MPTNKEAAMQLAKRVCHRTVIVIGASWRGEDMGKAQRECAELIQQAIDDAVAEKSSEIEYLERMLHNSLHRIPKSTEDCANFCYLTFTRYADGRVGHMCGGSLNPLEAFNAVYGALAPATKGKE